MRALISSLLAATAATAATAAATASVVGAGAAAACDRAAYGIVLDVGHTDRAPGAISASGVPEVSFNRRLAAAVAAQLAAAGFRRVTILEGRGVGHADLLDRAARASALHPAALLSLHHDSVQAGYLRPWGGGRLRASDHASGFSLFVSRRNVEPGASLALAERISAALTGRGLRFTAHHAEPIPGENRPWADAAHGIYDFDELVVLKATRAPAVLFESGVIVNPEEEAALASDERRKLVAEALAEAFAAACEATGR